jgi:hypothetical protein
MDLWLRQKTVGQLLITPQSETELLLPCLGAISGFARACGKMTAYICAEAISGV